MKHQCWIDIKSPTCVPEGSLVGLILSELKQANQGLYVRKITDAISFKGRCIESFIPIFFLLQTSPGLVKLCKFTNCFQRLLDCMLAKYWYTNHTSWEVDQGPLTKKARAWLRLNLSVQKSLRKSYKRVRHLLYRRIPRLRNIHLNSQPIRTLPHPHYNYSPKSQSIKSKGSGADWLSGHNFELVFFVVVHTCSWLSTCGLQQQ